jgi:hypothetical protein
MYEKEIKALKRFKLHDTPFSQKELKRRYRLMAARYHPDRGGSTFQMAGINADYDLLRNTSYSEIAAAQKYLTTDAYRTPSVITVTSQSDPVETFDVTTYRVRPFWWPQLSLVTVSLGLVYSGNITNLVLLPFIIIAYKVLSDANVKTKVWIVAYLVLLSLTCAVSVSSYLTYGHIYSFISGIIA